MSSEIKDYAHGRDPNQRPDLSGRPDSLPGSEEEKWKEIRTSIREQWQALPPEQQANVLVDLMQEVLSDQRGDPVRWMIWVHDEQAEGREVSEEKYQKSIASLLDGHPYLSEWTARRIYMADFDLRLQGRNPIEVSDRATLESFLWAGWEEADPDERERMNRNYPETMEKRRTLSKEEFSRWFLDQQAEWRRKVARGEKVGKQFS